MRKKESEFDGKNEATPLKWFTMAAATAVLISLSVIITLFVINLSELKMGNYSTDSGTIVVQIQPELQSDSGTINVQVNNQEANLTQ